MSIKVQHSRPETEQIERDRLVPLFRIYCDHKFGPDSWKNYMRNPNFHDLMEMKYPEFGDAVFSKLVDIVVENESLGTKNLLRDFSKFINKYY